QLHRLLVEGSRFVPQVVRTHDGRITSRVAAADPALLEYRDVSHPMHLLEIVGGGESMPAAADNHHLVFLLRLRTFPLAFPVLVIRHAIAQQAEYRIAAHGVSSIQKIGTR